MVFTGIKKISNTLFFLLIWGYFASFGKYILIYQESHSLFLFDPLYFQKFLRFPGGVTEYLSSFFVQFFYYPFWSAVLIATFLWLIAFLTQKIFNKFPHRIFFLSFLPSLIFLNFLKEPDFGIDLPIAFCLNLLAIFIFLIIKKSWCRYVFALLAGILLYFVTAGIFHLFWIGIILIEILFYQSKYKWIFLPVFIAISVFLPATAGIHIYHIHFNESYFRLLGNSIQEMPALFFLFMAFYFLLPVILWVTRKKEWKLFSQHQKIVSISKLIVLIAVTIFILKFSFNKKVGQMIYTAHEAKLGNWEEVLSISHNYEGSNFLMSYYTNLALLHTGQMSTNLFDYNQELGAKGLFFAWDRSRKKSEHGGQLYFDLGFINEAHHWAFESLISNGENADQLKMLAITNLINNKTESAAKYLRKLEISLFYSDWAKQQLLLTENPEQWSNNSFIQEKRKQLPHTDFFMNLNNLAPDLVQILQSNPDNKAAYQYLQSYYLLSNQVDLFAECLKEFQEPNSPIPSIYQQALIIYLSAHPDKQEIFKEFKIDQGTQQKFSEYAKAMQLYRPHRGNISEKFNTEFGSTYWYYLHFVSPHGNKVITKNKQAAEYGG